MVILRGRFYHKTNYLGEGHSLDDVAKVIWDKYVEAYEVEYWLYKNKKWLKLF